MLLAQAALNSSNRCELNKTSQHRSGAMLVDQPAAIESATMVMKEAKRTGGGRSP